jgi:hypothetical protein
MIYDIAEFLGINGQMCYLAGKIEDTNDAGEEASLVRQRDDLEHRLTEAFIEAVRSAMEQIKENEND